MDREPEPFAVSTHGGPVPGVRMFLISQELLDGINKVSWPLPETLNGPPGSLGFYSKVSESELKSQPSNSSVVRGAVYEWIPQS